MFMMMQTHRRLSHLQVSVSTTTSLTNMDQLCHNFDARVTVLEWKADIEETLKSIVFVIHPLFIS